MTSNHSGCFCSLVLPLVRFFTYPILLNVIVFLFLLRFEAVNLLLALVSLFTSYKVKLCLVVMICVLGHFPSVCGACLVSILM
jgi:hypothetical protein